MLVIILPFNIRILVFERFVHAMNRLCQLAARVSLDKKLTKYRANVQERACKSLSMPLQRSTP